MKSLAFFFLIIFFPYCQTTIVQNKKEIIELTSAPFPSSVRYLEILKKIETIQNQNDYMVENIYKLINLIENEKIKDRSIKNILSKLDKLNVPSAKDFIIKNIFYKLPSEVKLRSWDYEEYPYFLTMTESENKDYYIFLLLNSDILNLCNLEESQLKMISFLFQSGSIKFELVLSPSKKFVDNSTEECRQNNLNKLNKLMLEYK
ncbi:MAG: hypothetical protein ABIO44_00790 [Saprospiraceae bacterium]